MITPYRRKRLRAKRRRPKLFSEWRALVEDIWSRVKPLRPRTFALKVAGRFVTFVFAPISDEFGSTGLFDSGSNTLFVYYTDGQDFDAKMTVVHELAHLFDTSTRYDPYDELPFGSYAECLAQATEFAFVNGRVSKQNFFERKFLVEHAIADELPEREKKVRVRYFNWLVRALTKEMHGPIPEATT